MVCQIQFGEEDGVHVMSVTQFTRLRVSVFVCLFFGGSRNYKLNGLCSQTKKQCELFPLITATEAG